MCLLCVVPVPYPTLFLTPMPRSFSEAVHVTVPRFHVLQTPSTVEIREASHLATLSLALVAAVFVPVTPQDPRLLGVTESRPALYSEPGSQSSGWKRELRKWALLSPALVSHVG